MIYCENCDKKLGRREDIGDVNFCSDACQTALQREERLKNILRTKRGYINRYTK